MGKMNLTKNSRDAKKRAKGNSGIPNWLLTTIIMIVIVAVLGTVAMTVINSTGLIMRINNAATSENYEVNGNMMAYFYGTAYNNLRNSYGSYWKNLSVYSAETIEQHRTILVGANSEDLNYFADYEGKSWFDVFMELTLESVKSMLVYCEAAADLGITYTEQDEKDAEAAWDETIAQFKEELEYYGYDSSSYSESRIIAMLYGSTSVKRGDILDAMKISTLASKCSAKIQEQITDAITDDRINSEYNENKQKYDVIDYFYYEYKVDYADVEKTVKADNPKATTEELKTLVVAEYKKQIEEVKATTAKLAAAESLEAFKKIIFDETAYDKYDELLKDKAVADNKKPATDILATIKDKTVTAVIDEVLKGEEKTADDVKEETTGEGDKKTTTYTLYGESITKEFATAIRSVRESLYTALTRIESTYEFEKSNKDDSDFKKWAFDSARKDGETKSIAKGDGASDGKFEVKEKKYTETVYFLTKAQYQLTENTRDIMGISFTSTDTAKKAIADLKALVDSGKAVTKEKFEEIAVKYGTTAETVEDYVEGTMGTYAFDEWAFGDDVKKGDYTESPITMSDGSVLVAFYLDDGEATWKILVKNNLISEDFTAKEKALTKKYGASLDVSQWVIDRIS